MTADGGSGGSSVVSPTHAAPSARANARSASLRAKTNTGERGYRCRASWSTRCADAPKPVSPSGAPSTSRARRRERQPIAPAHSSGAASASGMSAGSACAKAAGTVSHSA
jgi:hypothetical protein